MLLVRGPLERWLHRPRAWAGVVLGNTVVMTLFCWHLTAVFLVQGVLLLLGVKPPPAGTPGWWAVLPAWVLGCAVPLVLLVALFRRAERMPAPQPTPRTAAAVAGVVAAALGIFVVSQVGLVGLLAGRPEQVQSLSGPAWPGRAALVLGLVLLRTRRPGSPHPAQQQRWIRTVASSRHEGIHPARRILARIVRVP